MLSSSKLQVFTTNRPRICSSSTNQRSYALKCTRTSRTIVESERCGTESQSQRYKIVACKAGTATVAGQICAEAFELGDDQYKASEVLDKLKARYADVIQRDIQANIVKALEKKRQATLEYRLYKLERQARLLKLRQAAALVGRNVLTLPESPAERRQVQRWRRQIMFMVLLAVDRASGEVLGCASLSLLQPEAMLPPPLPSSAPYRLVVSNVAVRRRARNRGVASNLLTACDRIGRAWRQEALWLTVDNSNGGAERLYAKAGYEVVRVGLPALIGGGNTTLMRKFLPRCSSIQEGQSGVMEGQIRKDGVFVWTETAADDSKRPTQ